MCGRYSLYHDKAALETHFGIPFTTLAPRYNLAPSERVVFVFSNADEARQAGHARWGLVPHWSKEGKTKTPLFNARSETVLKKPAFKGAFIRGRCLVPASGWFEWKREEGAKQPYHVCLKSGEPFALAGLFDVWRSGDGKERLVSLCVLTTEAPEGLNWLHERMPVVLDYDRYDQWLDRSTPDIGELPQLLQPFPAEELEVVMVSKKVNRTGVDGPELVLPDFKAA